MNQTHWEGITQSWIPIDYIKYSTLDISNLLFLTIHPEKVIDFLKVNVRFGYFNVFDITFTKEAVYFVWIVEIFITYRVIYAMVFNEKKQ